MKVRGRSLWLMIRRHAIFLDVSIPAWDTRIYWKEKFHIWYRILRKNLINQWFKNSSKIKSCCDFVESRANRNYWNEFEIWVVPVHILLCTHDQNRSIVYICLQTFSELLLCSTCSMFITLMDEIENGS